MLIRVLLLLGKESDGMLAPMTKRVEMVRSVVSIVIAIAITLRKVSL